MAIASIDTQKEAFKEYTDRYIFEATEDKKNGYLDKRNHSLFVLDETLLTDALFTKYNPQFLNLLALESLFHDIGRFEQLKQMGTFKDDEVSKYFPGSIDHGDLGAKIVKDEGILKDLIPDVRLYDEEVQKVIELHSKVNPELLNKIMLDYIVAFRSYDLTDLFLSKKAKEEKEVLTATNTAIIQDVDRLDIFRKIVNGIWVPMTTDQEIDPELFKLYKEGKLPTMREIQEMGKWNPNVGHLVRMSFINQMNLVPVLQKIKEENLIEKVYKANGNPIVRPAYDVARDQLEQILHESEGEVIVKKR